MSKRASKSVVQVENPRSGHYVKINRSEGRIVSHKSTSGPCKGIPIARKSNAK